MTVPLGLFLIVYFCAGIIMGQAFCDAHPEDDSIWIRLFILTLWFPALVVTLILKVVGVRI